MFLGGFGLAPRLDFGAMQFIIDPDNVMSWMFLVLSRISPCLEICCENKTGMNAPLYKPTANTNDLQLHVHVHAHTLLLY